MYGNPFLSDSNPSSPTPVNSALYVDIPVREPPILIFEIITVPTSVASSLRCDSSTTPILASSFLITENPTENGCPISEEGADATLLSVSKADSPLQFTLHDASPALLRSDAPCRHNRITSAEILSSQSVDKTKGSRLRILLFAKRNSC